jgi:hypothetical protein
MATFVGMALDTAKARACIERARREAAEGLIHPAVAEMNAHYAEWMTDERNAQRMMFASANMGRSAHANAEFEAVLDEALGLRRPRPQPQLASVPVE